MPTRAFNIEINGMSSGWLRTPSGVSDFGSLAHYPFIERFISWGRRRSSVLDYVPDIFYSGISLSHKLESVSTGI